MKRVLYRPSIVPFQHGKMFRRIGARLVQSQLSRHSRMGLSASQTASTAVATRNSEQRASENNSDGQQANTAEADYVVVGSGIGGE